MKSSGKVMVIRAKPHGVNREKQFLKGVISIGWPTKFSLEGMDRQSLESAVRKAWPNSSSVDISQVFNFVNLPAGSIVLTPSYDSRDIHVFRTKTGYSFREDWISEGNPHTIEAEYLKTVSRSIFDKVVQRALLAAKKTVTNFTPYSDHICRIAQSSGNDQAAPDSDSNAKAEAVQTLRQLLKSKDENVRLQASLALLGQNR